MQRMKIAEDIVKIINTINTTKQCDTMLLIAKNNIFPDRQIKDQTKKSKNIR